MNRYAIIEPIDDDTKGILMPENMRKERAQRGKVIALAETNVNDHGVDLPIQCKVGDTVYFGQYSGEQMKVDDKEYVAVDIQLIRSVEEL